MLEPHWPDRERYDRLDSMKFLIVARQKKNVDAFRTAIAVLLRQGHTVRLALQDRDAARDERVADGLDSARLVLEAAPTARGDEWRTQAPLVRRLRDWIQYLSPDYAGTDKLRMRVVDRLRAELGIADPVFGDGLVPGLATAQVERLRDLLVRVEAVIPSDPLHHEFMCRDRPDVVLVTPGVHFGSAQADFIKSACAAGIPVWMLVFSWDNLSTKGALHVPPDLMFVWNERQRTEAAALHGYPPERVVVVGAPRFDEFFGLRAVLPRRRFLGPLGFDSDAPTLLYLCSSRFVARHELSFVRRWLAAVRTSADPALQRCNVIVRPHPDIPLLEDDHADVVIWPELPRAQGWVSRPFSDPRAIVLRTTYATPQALFECLHHSAAVVGLNTSAELEAGVAGRPVFTVVADDAAVTGQANTLHFHYLLRENGGFVVSAQDLETHIGHLITALTASAEPDDESIRTFVREFLRPRGDRPAAQVLAEELVARLVPSASAQVSSTSLPASLSPSPFLPSASFVPPVGKTRLLRVGYHGSALRVRATHETRKRRRDGALVLDPDTVAWLDAYIQPNDVFYDIGAGIGEYALVAAAHRNVLSIAFEPGFATYKRLCEHVLLNDCRRSVVPLPIALGDRTGLLELEYKNAAGEERHRLKPDPWRRRPYDAESRYVQPVCAERLDDVIARYRLPRPAHIRMHVPGSIDAVVRGAVDTLRDAALKSVWVVAPRSELRAALEEQAAACGLALIPSPKRSEPFQRLLFVREAARVRKRV